MSNRHIAPALLLAGALLAQGVSAQTPLRSPQYIVPPGVESPFLASVALDGVGNLTALWTTIGGTSSGFSERAWTRRFSAAGAPLGAAVPLEAPRFRSDAGTVVANQRGDVLMTWSRSPVSGSGSSGTSLRRTSPVQRTLTLSLKAASNVAVDGDGNFVVVWNASTPDGFRVFGQRYNYNGTKRGPEFNAATSKTGSHISPSVAMNPATGEFVIVWEVRDADGNGLGVYGQRFGFTTGRQGSEFPIFVPPASERPGSLQLFAAQVARAGDGKFVVIWRSPNPDGLYLDILGQRYGNDGAPLGARLVIYHDFQLPDSRPQIAMSLAGDFVVTWDDQGTSPQWFRLFHRDGTPAGPVISQPGLGGAPYYGTGRVAYGWNGTFVYGWTNYNDEGDVGNTISFQRFSGSPGDEVCLFRDGHFRCDTGRTAGAPEIDHVFVVRNGRPVLGDVDGDGREDYCLFRDNRFDCDTGHNFGAAETTILFGQPGDWPLLGDVDGDGRADACVYREDRFLCDTAHDGGTPETTIVFGIHGDWPLLGDVDGDGRADACVHRDQQFLCDTAHDGGAPEVTVAFGLEDQPPLLGDFDGDGRKDFCTFSSNSILRCDTAHNGGDPEIVFALTGTGQPLMGNLDGL
jgi:hypothetical protein